MIIDLLSRVKRNQPIQELLIVMEEVYKTLFSKPIKEEKEDK